MPQLILLGGFTTHQPEVQPFPTALLLLWSCSGAELTWVCAAARRAPSAWCTGDPHWYHSSQTAASPRALGNTCNGITKIILCTLRLQHTYLPETEGALKSSTTLVPAASPALQPSSAPRRQPGWSCHSPASGELGSRGSQQQGGTALICASWEERHRGSGKSNKMVGCCCPAWLQDAPVICWIPCWQPLQRSAPFLTPLVRGTFIALAYEIKLMA